MYRKNRTYFILLTSTSIIILFVYFHTYAISGVQYMKINQFLSEKFSFHGKNELSDSKQDKYKRKGFVNQTVICLLIDWKNDQDIRNIKKKLLPSIQYLKPMDFIIFSDREPSETVQVDIKKVSHHKFQFVKIKFTFPEGFDYINTKSPLNIRSKWGYLHMIRFWFKNIWLEPALQPYKFVLRFDTDSCLVGKKFSFPTNEDLVYVWMYFRYDATFITNLKSTILNYIKTKNITVKNKKMFEFYKQPVVPLYYNNMEIVSIAFMNRPEVKDFTNYIDASHGQYKYRWGDAPLRYATLTMFAEENSVQPLSVNLGQGYSHPC